MKLLREIDAFRDTNRSVGAHPEDSTDYFDLAIDSRDGPPDPTEPESLDAPIELLGRLFAFALSEPLHGFLRTHPEAIAVLAELVVRLPASLSRRPPRLALARDPEEGVSTLIVTLPTSLSFDSALREFEAFEESWWFAVPARVRRHIAIMVGPA